MAFSLSHTIAGTTATSTALAYMFDTFIPNYGWTTSAHPNGNSVYRSLSRSYTNQLTGNTLTNYHWVRWTSANNYQMYEDATYTTVPGDLGTNTVGNTTNIYENSSFTGKDWKFWTSSERSIASLVTRGKYVIWFDPGVTDVFAYEDTAWNGSIDRGTTHFFPYNYNYGHFIHLNAPAQNNTSYNQYQLLPVHEGTPYYQPSVDSIIKGFDYAYSSDVNSVHYGTAYRITGNDMVLHVPGSGNQNNKGIGGAGVVVQVGSDYYFRLTGGMNQTAPMLYMGTSEPDFT